MLDNMDREAQGAAVGVATRDGPDQRTPAEGVATAVGTVPEAAPESYVRWFDGLTRSDVAVAGGKGANLAELARAGIPVAPGFVVTVGAYERFAEAGRLTTEIAHRIEALNVDDTARLDESASAIRDLVRRTRVPDDVRDAITTAYRRLTGITCSICGQAPSVHPDYAEQLVRWGIDSISVTPDALERTRRNIARAEQRFMLETARSKTRR